MLYEHESPEDGIRRALRGPALAMAGSSAFAGARRYFERALAPRV